MSIYINELDEKSLQLLSKFYNLQEVFVSDNLVQDNDYDCEYLLNTGYLDKYSVEETVEHSFKYNRVVRKPYSLIISHKGKLTIENYNNQLKEQKLLAQEKSKERKRYIVTTIIAGLSLLVSIGATIISALT